MAKTFVVPAIVEGAFRIYASDLGITIDSQSVKIRWPAKVYFRAMECRADKAKLLEAFIRGANNAIYNMQQEGA